MTTTVKRVRPVWRFLLASFRATRTLAFAGLVVYIPVYFLDTPASGMLPLGFYPATMILGGITLIHLVLGILKALVETGLIVSGNRHEITEFDL